MLFECNRTDQKEAALPWFQTLYITYILWQRVYANDVIIVIVVDV